ncbi:hypothetical protein CC78DRAFT_594418 [Lojkania enalia]|uniref:Uncharacterized protein n=1 Tax=Lojkania enalia TaxID=147567 RepID=A0A9P4MV43_9PLEO|nr:hypothetical protein CC78DRAFT_594418 [Didymosphaeria enalia]
MFTVCHNTNSNKPANFRGHTLNPWLFQSSNIFHTTLDANSKIGVERVFSRSSVSKKSQFGDGAVLKRAFEIMIRKEEVHVNAAHLYGDSEELFGNADAGQDFILDSKIKGGFSPYSAKTESVISGTEQYL